MTEDLILAVVMQFVQVLLFPLGLLILVHIFKKLVID